VEECKTDGGRKADKRKQLNGGRNSAASKHERDSLLELFDSLCEFLRQSLSLYMQHVYASHVMRAVLQVLSAQPADDAIIHGRRHGVGQRRQCSCSNSGPNRSYYLHQEGYVFTCVCVCLPAYLTVIRLS